MGSKLLIRSYNVGCGDCIYVRIPDGDDFFHILIDCGSKEMEKSRVMERAIKHMEENMLPDADVEGKKRLDMIVVTHRHEDHIKGFDPKFFKNIVIGHIWITAAMDKSHPQAKRVNALHSMAAQEMRELARSKVPLSPELEDLVALYGIRNEGATKALIETLPQNNGIVPKFVYAGQTSDDLGIKIADTMLTVLGPEKDIDGYYLGKDADESLRAMMEGGEQFKKQAKPRKSKTPPNISKSDFRNLQRRLLSNALAFAVDDTTIQNNVSTVILIEWGQRRLLFVGDAEWHSSYRKGRKNGSWNVMWEEHKELLSKPLDFLKVGHHGSHNSTPWNHHNADHPINEILDAILPLPEAGQAPTAKCVVSTKRKQYDTIPDAKLLAELGKRVVNTRVYLEEFKEEDSTFDADEDIYNYSVMKTYSKEPSPREVAEKGWLDKAQPLRTDMESAGKGLENMLDFAEFVDVEIAPTLP